MKEKILAMEAGKLLDSMIAEDVMGWRDIRLMTNTSNNFTSLQGRRLDEYSMKKIPSYSTNISAAWEVLEQFPIAKVEFVEIFKGNKSYSVMFPRDTGDIIISNVNSLPLAICKAALLTVIES